MQDNLIRSIAKAAALDAVRFLSARESAQTTNATPATVVTITPELYTSGLLEVTVVGKADLGIGGLRGKQVVGYEMGSALTLDTPVNVYTLVTEITGATFSISASSGNILIQVTGVAATVINWTVETKLINQSGTTLP